jgi:hypothetical protein
VLLRRQRKQAAQEQADAGCPADAEGRTYKDNPGVRRQASVSRTAR